MPTSNDILPTCLQRLHLGEEHLRDKALLIIRDERPQLRLHLNIIEAAMDLADELRQFETSDEDMKVVQVLGMRTFNAFGSSLKLVLSGYHQNGVLILRDVLETAFLLDLFSSERALIERWRFADKKVRRKEFSPIKVREALDRRDGFESMKRFKRYELFSELAGHPNMKSSWMMRPQKDGDAVIGPFMEATPLEAALSEMAQLATQVGEKLDTFYPLDWQKGFQTRASFSQIKREWIAAFIQ